MASQIPVRGIISGLLVAAAVAFAAKVVLGKEVRGRTGSKESAGTVHAELVNMPSASNSSSSYRIDFDSLMGRSGQLRARILETIEVDFYPGIRRRFGPAMRTPGIRRIDTGRYGNDASFAFVTMAPWRMKVGSRINGYHVGFWPGEQKLTNGAYDNPVGFVKVTRENANTPLSTHFALRDFVTHDQQDVWPKYVVLREELLDKLELILSALESFGVQTRHVVVLSGFRSPQYNARGASEGMARSSRHQFGDAADIIIDANRDGRMDDLNHDGRVTFADLEVIDRAVQLIEEQYPELTGGLGLYHEMGPSGPFAHVDVRGTRARWTNTVARKKTPSAVSTPGSATQSQPSKRCIAEGEMAILCAGVR